MRFRRNATDPACCSRRDGFTRSSAASRPAAASPLARVPQQAAVRSGGRPPAWAAGSLKNYWAVEGRFDMPDLAGGRLLLSTYARRNNYPQEDYFGIGPDALRVDHSSFRFTNTLVGARVGVKPAPIADLRRRPRISAAGSDRAEQATPDNRRPLRRRVRTGIVRPAQLRSYECVPRDRLPAAEKRTEGRLVPPRGQSLRGTDRSVHVQPFRRRPSSVREHPRRAPRARRASFRIDVRPGCRGARPVLPDAYARRARHAARVPRLSVSRTARNSDADRVPL